GGGVVVDRGAAGRVVARDRLLQPLDGAVAVAHALVAQAAAVPGVGVVAVLLQGLVEQVEALLEFALRKLRAAVIDESLRRPFRRLRGGSGGWCRRGRGPRLCGRV